MLRAAHAAFALWNRVCVVPVLLVRGERALRRDRPHLARGRFAAAVARAPSCFRAHFGLARSLAATSDDARARREFVIARHLAPSRFRELRRTLPARYRDAELMLPAPPGRSAGAGAPPKSSAGTSDPVTQEPAPGADARERGVRSIAERERLRALGAIRDDELRDIDWDRLAAQLGCADV